MILDRGAAMGMDFKAEIAALYQVDWPIEMKKVGQRSVAQRSTARPSVAQRSPGVSVC